jgi:hypothetical protein
MIEIKVNSSGALAKFSPAGIPEAVRRALRRVLPQLTIKLGAKVDDLLGSGLKSRTTLRTTPQLIENPTALYGRVTISAVAPSPSMLPAWLDTGTRPHVIAARNANALYFFWEKLGKNVSFRQVNHPGFAGIQYRDAAIASMSGEIVDTISQAVREGAASA